MKEDRFRVLSDSAKWTFWTTPHLIARVATRFDEPEHPYGQWTVRLSRVGGPASDGQCSFLLEFLVDEAPWRCIEPGMTLSCYDGTRHIADLLVQPESPV